MRKTVERFAVLDAAYSLDTLFTIEELRHILEGYGFPVSRATIYNSLKLFQELRLIACHRLSQGIRYEAVYSRNNHCHQICTSCGKITNIASDEVLSAVGNMKFKRFNMESFSLYVYGMCSSCAAKQQKGHKKATRNGVVCRRINIKHDKK
ncbi:MAG: transcriptional repressor [Prevotella sp.]|uniref:Fur family transcriptional regulator n=1 Tax=Prevotella sp. TaxID=59823 RepID=UPI002A8272AE|nr:transcriptional repressor [Prevotella sp.]MDY4019269.1 transcriptional repressor [Prevotella sp.]